MQRITPSLWFGGQAEEAARFYTTLFRKSKITAITRYDDAAARASGRPAGSVMTVAFQLDGQEFVALNGGPQFKFSEAVSFAVRCETQKEVDDYWARLTEGGEEGPCGWLKDRYGLSWQVVPTILPKLLSDPDPKRAQRAMQAMLQMKKIDIEALQQG